MDNNKSNDKQSKKYNDHKLTPVVPSRLSRFKLPLRYPGWRPDKAQEVNDDGTLEAITAVFVEETLGAYATEDKKIIIRQPFQPRFEDLSDPKWILGYTLKENGVGKFNEWLRDLSNACRRYNGGLYRLRQLHLKAEGNLLPMERLHVDDKDHEAEDAEKWFKEDVENLDRALNSFNNGEEEAIVDFVQVNGYIVSIRAVAKVFAGGIDSKDAAESKGPQPVGSSSSHWSLSSAFSSHRQ